MNPGEEPGEGSWLTDPRCSAWLSQRWLASASLRRPSASASTPRGTRGTTTPSPPRSPPTAATWRSRASPATWSRATRTATGTSSSTTARPARPSASASTPRGNEANGDVPTFPRSRPTAATWRSRASPPTSSRTTRTASYDVFVHDRQTGTTERVSVDSSGNQGNEDSYEPSISADGRYVAFESIATNLVPGDTNGDGTSSSTTARPARPRASASTPRATRATPTSADPSISADGRFVAF